MYLTEAARRRGPRRGKHSVPVLSLSDTRLSTWEERDRAHVELINAKNDATIVEWWDDDVRQAIEDGFLKPGKLHQSAYDYAVHIGLIQRPHGETQIERRSVRVQGQRIGSRSDTFQHAKRHSEGEAWIVESQSRDGRGIVDVYTRGPKGRFKFNRYFDVDGVWYLSDMTMFAKAIPAGASSLHEAKENPTANDFGDVDIALSTGIKEFSATHYDYRGKGDLPRIFSPIPKSSGRAHSFLMWELYQQKGRYHWPRDSKHVKKIPAGAIAVESKMSVTYGPGWDQPARKADECACDHCVKENPVDVSDGIPWVTTERNVEDFEEVRAVAEKVGPIKGSRDIYELMHPWTSRQDQEHLCVVLLDIHSMLRGVAMVHKGMRDRVSVDTQDVLKPAVDRGAKGLAILHNHPSGSAQHSKADADLTKAVKAACKPAGIAFVDHLVIGSGEYYSFADKKLHKVRSR